jgi:hypothetical protein
VNYIYKYVFDNKIYYIGQTINLYNRINQHLNDAGFKGKNFEIYYFEVPNKTLTNAYEICLIKKYKPQLNTMYINNSTQILNIEEPEWKLYMGTIYNDDPSINNFQEISVKQDYYTAIEIAKILGIHRSTIYTWKKKDEIIMEDNYVSHEELIRICNKNPGWFISLESASKLLGVSLTNLLLNVECGIIPSIELNGNIKIAKKTLKKLDKNNLIE